MQIIYISREIGALSVPQGTKAPEMDQKWGEKHKIALFQCMSRLKRGNFINGL